MLTKDYSLSKNFLPQFLQMKNQLDFSRPALYEKALEKNELAFDAPPGIRDDNNPKPIAPI